MSRRLRFGLLVAWAAVVAVLVPLALWGGIVGFEYFRDGGRYVSTTAASVSGDLVVVASVNAGRVVRVYPGTGASVREGDALAEVELAAPVRLTASGTPVLAFLGTTDQEVRVTAPVDGSIASILVAEGTAVTAGQPIMRIVDPAHLRVTAYVSEADLPRVRTGQDAEVYLTAVDRTITGVVQAVVPASSVAFATPPAAGAAIAPTVYAVFVRVDLRDTPQLLGSSAEVRIRVR